MPNFRLSDITDKTFQRNDHIGRAWRKRYIKENGGSFQKAASGWLHDSLLVQKTTKKGKKK